MILNFLDLKTKLFQKVLIKFKSFSLFSIVEILNLLIVLFRILTLE